MCDAGDCLRSGPENGGRDTETRAGNVSSMMYDTEMRTGNVSSMMYDTETRRVHVFILCNRISDGQHRKFVCELKQKIFLSQRKKKQII